MLAVILIGIGVYALLPLLSGSPGEDVSAVEAGGGVAAGTGEKIVRVSDPATAARIPTEAEDILQSYVLFDGRDPTVFESSPGNPVHFDGDSIGGFARVSSSASDAGVRAIIGPGLAAKLAGKTLRIVITARSSKDGGAANFRFAYQSGVAISHWQTANLKPDYAALGLIWRVPAVRTDPSGDHLLIEPGIPGDGTGARHPVDPHRRPRLVATAALRRSPEIAAARAAARHPVGESLGVGRGRVEADVGLERRLVGRVDAGEVLDLAGARLR